MLKNSFSMSLLVSLFVLLGLVFSAGINAGGGFGYVGDNDSSQVTLKILPIKVPLNIEFAGERMPLEVADVKERMAGQGLFVVANSTEQFAEFLKMEIPKWAKIVKEAGIKPQ